MFFYIQGMPVPDAKLFVKGNGVVVSSNSDKHLQKEVKFTLLSKHNYRKMYQENRKINQLISNLNT
jgi:hypothetical protein